MTTAAEPLVRRDPDPLVRRDRDTRGVAILTLNRPEAFNALSEAMLRALVPRHGGVRERLGLLQLRLASAKLLLARLEPLLPQLVEPWRSRRIGGAT